MLCIRRQQEVRVYEEEAREHGGDWSLRMKGKLSVLEIRLARGL